MIPLIENNECSFSKKEVTGEINFMLWAEMDTTSTSLSFTMMLLGFHQDVQRKVLEELDAVFGDDVERSVTMEDLNNLKYTEQVIKESLCLYPVVPFVPRTSTEDIEINGYTIPKGCDVFFNIYYLHRNPKIYPNPDEFDPENFSPERSKGRHPYSFLPFSGGLRKCVGYKYPMFQMKIVLATVLRHFTVHPACDRKEIDRWEFTVVKCRVSDVTRLNADKDPEVSRRKEQPCDNNAFHRAISQTLVMGQCLSLLPQSSFNTTSALANYATEAGSHFVKTTLGKPVRESQSRLRHSVLLRW
uniref:Cytochrome P450 n=1 Tax=Timema douglasi TaxID=61478 RepID=A0A7R8VL90_TIMDO|nr:unnamed protein product [Timema douglasi]